MTSLPCLVARAARKGLTQTEGVELARLWELETATHGAVRPPDGPEHPRAADDMPESARGPEAGVQGREDAERRQEYALALATYDTDGRPWDQLTPGQHRTYLESADAVLTLRDDELDAAMESHRRSWTRAERMLRKAEQAVAEREQAEADLDHRDETIRHLDNGLEHERAAIARARAVVNAIDAEMRTEPDTQRSAMQLEAVARIRAALNTEK